VDRGGRVSGLSFDSRKCQSQGSFEEQQKLAADGLRRLSEFASTHKIDVIVENHGGLSSNGAWLAV